MKKAKIRNLGGLYTTYDNAYMAVFGCKYKWKHGYFPDSEMNAKKKTYDVIGEFKHEGFNDTLIGIWDGEMGMILSIDALYIYDDGNEWYEIE